MDQNRLIERYIDFYNNFRPCSVIQNQTPAEYGANFELNQLINQLINERLETETVLKVVKFVYQLKGFSGCPVFPYQFKFSSRCADLNKSRCY